MTNVTNHMLRKKFAETVEQSRQYMKVQHSKDGTVSLDDRINTVLSVEDVVRVQGDYVITSSGTKAQLFSPMPCLYWKCTGSNVDGNGVVTLKNKLKGLFVSDGSNTYCLGVNGYSDEFELLMQVGTNEVRLGNLFLNLTAPHVVVNGVERSE